MCVCSYLLKSLKKHYNTFLLNRVVDTLISCCTIAAMFLNPSEEVPQKPGREGWLKLKTTPTLCLEYTEHGTLLCWSYQGLHNGVVGGVHVGIEGEGALSITVVGCIAFRSNDPVLRETQDSKG